MGFLVARRWRRGDWLYIYVVGLFAASMGLAHWLGISFSGNKFGMFWQFLDADLLKNDLARSIWNLHSQPPLLNVYFGLVLKLLPTQEMAAYSACFTAAGLMLLLGMASTMRRCGVSDAINAAVCTLFAGSANFLVYTNWLFYTLPIAFILLVAAASCAKYAESGRSVWAHSFSWACGAAILLRATYHPVWFAVTLAAVAWTLPRPLRRTLAVSALLPFLVVNGWYLKNLVQVGMYTSSSWVGMNLAHSWPLSPEEVSSAIDSGEVPAVWQIGGFQSAEGYQAFGYFDLLGSSELHPSDGAPYKSNGEPNFNHREYASVSMDMLKGGMSLIREFPGRYVERTRNALLLYLQPGPNSTHFLVTYDFSGALRLKDATTKWFFAGKPSLAYDGRTPAPNLLFVFYPMLLIYGGWVAIGRRRCGGHRPATRALLAFAVVTALWGGACSVGMEVGENDRMRWETDALMLMVSAHLAQCGLSWVRGLLRIWVARRSQGRQSG